MSSGGPLAGVEITEVVNTKQDDFDFTVDGNIVEGERTCLIDTENQFLDNFSCTSTWLNLQTLINRQQRPPPFMAKYQQTLEWFCDDDNVYVSFANVDMSLTLERNEQAAIYEVISSDNGIQHVQSYAN